MTSLIVNDDDKFHKVMLNPVFHNLKIWEGDKVQITDYISYSLESDELDEPHISSLIFAKGIINMSMKTGLETSTDLSEGSVSVRKAMRTNDEPSACESLASVKLRNSHQNPEAEEKSLAENDTDSELI
jgi:hypothetical protein